MKKQDVFNALFFAVRIASARQNDDSSFYGTLSISCIAGSLFGVGSPEESIIDSYLHSKPVSPFVGPLQEVPSC